MAKAPLAVFALEEDSCENKSMDQSLEKPK